MTPDLAPTPLASAIGPFASRSFLEVVHRHWSQGELVMVDTDEAFFALERGPEGLIGVGHRDLVDYRSPAGAASTGLIAEMAREAALQLDSLPDEAARALSDALSAAGVKHEISEHDIAAVLALPDGYEEWLMLLSKKERHETRRKRRRYEAMVGPILVDSFGSSRFDEFVALHRQSRDDKGQFMTDKMAAYFSDLLDLDGWSIDGLVDAEGALVAAGFGFSDGEGRFLYNSAFDWSRRDASPGVVLISSLIEDSCSKGHRVFDFLKGDETYKVRLGAVARKLFEVRTT
jgi:CelD/BcsL family acetyltransferase involved in cellulose biosynthesis